MALLLRNDLAFFEVSRAASLVGAFAVPLNWHLSAEEVDYILADSGAKVLVVHADLWVRRGATPPSGVEALLVETPAEVAASYGLPPQACAVPEGARDWDRWVDGFEPALASTTATSPVILYTSGTTGRPKGVQRFPITPGYVKGAASQMAAVFGVGADARTLITGPMYHSAPNLYGLAMG